MENLIVTLDIDEARAIEENAERDHLLGVETLKVCPLLNNIRFDSEFYYKKPVFRDVQ